MDVPALWGYDPDAIYRFVPSEFRLRPDGMDEAFLEAAKTMKPGDSVEAVGKAIAERFKGAPRPIQEGAPVFLLGSLSNAMDLRLQAARDSFHAVKRDTERRFLADLERIRSLDISEDEKREQIEARESKLNDESCARADKIFPVELQSSVLQECLRGWENIRAPFTGKISQDGRVLKGSWKSEIFWALVTETAFSEDAAQGFTSLPASTAG